MSSDNQNLVLRDLIYFDVAKAESILSQIEGGLVSEIETSSDETTEKRNVRNYDLKIFKPEFGGTQTESETTIERRRRHHEMYNLLEDFLLTEDFGVDVNTMIDPTEIKNGETHKKLSQYGFLKVTGWASLEDYTRLQLIMNRYNSIMKFSVQSQISSNPDWQSIDSELGTQLQAIENLTDRNKRSKGKRKLGQVQRQQEEILNSLLGENQLDEWQLDGINNIIETFLSDRLNLFIYPIDDYLPFHTVSSLKRTCLTDTDIEGFIQSYGKRPNLRLTALGLITSLPMPHNSLPDYNQKYVQLESNQVELEAAFAQVFDQLEEVENYFSYSHYPNITLYPIAIYREIERARSSKPG